MIENKLALPVMNVHINNTSCGHIIITVGALICNAGLYYLCVKLYFKMAVN